MQLTKETALIELADAILRRSESVQYRLDEEPGEGQLWEGIHNTEGRLRRYVSFDALISVAGEQTWWPGDRPIFPQYSTDGRTGCEC